MGDFMFTNKHIVFLIISIIYVFVILFLIKKKSIDFSIKWFLVIGIVSEVIKVFYYIVTNDNGNYLPATDLPFHLCSIQIIFLVILRTTTNQKIKRLLLTVMIPTGLFGGLAALFIPTSSSINGFLILSMQYFFYHATLIAFAIHVMRTIEIEFTVKDVLNCLSFLMLIGFLAIYVNGILGRESNANYMYVVRPPMDDLPLLNLNQGYIMYIVKYSILASLLVSLTFSKVFVKAFIASRKSEELNSFS